MATTAKKDKKKETHYVDNDEFYRLMVEYKKDGVITNEIGDALYKIADNYSTRASFIGYPFREDMVSDGVYNCLKYIDRFDPDKGTNPFAYFTQIIYFSFLRYLQKEKTQYYIKCKLINDGLDNSLDNTNDIDVGDYLEVDQSDNKQNHIIHIRDVIEKFETKMAEDKEKRKASANKKKKGIF